MIQNNHKLKVKISVIRKMNASWRGPITYPRKDPMITRWKELLWSTFATLSSLHIGPGTSLIRSLSTDGFHKSYTLAYIFAKRWQQHLSAYRHRIEDHTPFSNDSNVCRRSTCHSLSVLRQFTIRSAVYIRVLYSAIFHANCHVETVNLFILSLDIKVI